MKYLKLVQPGFENFTGDFGITPFKDGVSLEPVPRLLADRISSSLLVVEIDAPDAETPDDAQAGAASRLVTGNLLSITLKTLETATPEQMADEKARIAEAAKKAKIPESARFYEQTELEEIATSKGIDGLREIAKVWNVKDRSINGLIREIMKAQDANKQANANVERMVLETKLDASNARAISAAIADIMAPANEARAAIETAPVDDAATKDASVE